MATADHIQIPEDATEARKETVVGSTPVASFDFTWPYFNAADIKVYVDGVLQTTGYTLTPDTTKEGGYLGGEVVFDVALTDCTVILERDIALARQDDFEYPSNKLNIRALNTAFDRVYGILQQFRRLFKRTLRTPIGDTLDIAELPAAADRADLLLGFDENGQLDVRPESAAAQAAATAAAASASAASSSATTAATSATAAQTAETNAEAAQAAAEAAAASVPSLPLNPDDITFAATARVLARKTAGAGLGEEVTLSELLDFIGSAAQGDILYRGASAWKRLAAGTSGQFLKTNGAGADPAWAAAAVDIVHLRHEATSGTNGGTATTGSWLTRPLNTEAVDTGNICTLSSNQFSLPAGTYEVFGAAIFGYTELSKLKIYNVTDAADALLGQSARITNGYNEYQDVLIIGRFTIAATKTLELQYRVGITRSTDGLGVANSFGTEVYADLWLRKVA